MKTQKFSPVLFALLLMLFALTVAQAQTSGQNSGQNKDAAAWKQRVADQIATGLRTPPTTTAAPVTEAADESRQSDRGGSELQQDLRGFRVRQQNALVGTWDLILTFGDGSKVKSTLTVIPGRREGEGSILHAAEASLLKPSPTTPEQGTWEHWGGLRFVASYVGYAVDEKFEAPAGRIGFKHTIRVSGDQESFVGRAVFEVRDPEGSVVFTDNITTEGKRQHPDAP
ncbi:MAG: hypothetical protein JST84_33935 [Acidobacteria bacterium]|nr:hypothetical protein [Acidobacteriota bacterium]